MSDLEALCIEIARRHVHDVLHLADDVFLFWYGGLDARTQRHRVYAAHPDDVDARGPGDRVGAGSGNSMTLLVNDRTRRVEEVYRGQ